MRKNILKLAALLIAPLTAIVFTSGGAFAEQGQINSIRIVEGGNMCDLYARFDNTTMCDENKGRFEESTGVLTLGSGLTTDSRLIIENEDGAKIIVKANDDISMASIDSTAGSHIDIFFDLGEFSLDPSRIITGSGDVTMLSGALIVETKEGEGSAVVVARSLSVKGGSIVAKSGSTTPIVVDQLTIDNGTVETTGLSHPEIIINGGKMTFLKGNKSECRAPFEDVSINGGEFYSECPIAISGSAPVVGEQYVPKTLRVKGGKVEISYAGNQYPAIYADNLYVSSGELITRGGNTGIYVSKNAAVFNGGKTSIYLPSEKSVFSRVAITLGENMIIKPDDISIQTGKDEYGNDGQFIPAAELVTIYEEKHEEIPEEGSDKKEEDVKVPNTGSITGAEGGALAIFAASTAVVLVVIGLTVHLKNRNKDHYVFDK